MGPIGIFDSGYGGLTILEEIRNCLPQYDYLYLGDNARAPYGNRSFDVVYQFTLQAVRFLFEQDCPLVILACNTASAKALRSIQQKDLPLLAPQRRVLGILRPTVEAIGQLTQTRHVGLLGTRGTIVSQSYPIEIHKLYPDIHVYAEACPMWVSLVENGEQQSDGAAFFVQKDIERLFSQHPQIDTLILGCTHYPLLLEQIRKFIPGQVHILLQGKHVAERLKNYLERHPETDSVCTREGSCRFCTTEAPDIFEERASIFTNTPIHAMQVHLNV